MATVASLVINLTASTSHLEKGFLQATRLTDRFVKSTKSVTRQLDEIARYGRNAGLALTAMSLSVRKLVKASADHEESMLRVKAVARATVQEYHALSAAALQTSTTTRHSLSSIGEGMKFLAMAGFQAKEIAEMIPVVTRMATAGAVDMVTAADITTNILAGYGMAVEDLSKATDVLVAAFTGANVNLQLLGETFKHVGPVAKSAGLEFEEIAAAAALLGNAGIQGSIAGTSLKSAISRLISPSNTAARILKRLGVETTTSEGKLRDLADIIDDLSKAGATTADVLRIFGLRAGPSMARLLDVGADALRQYTQRLRDSEGWAELIEAEQMQSFNAQLDLTKNIIHAFSVELGDVLLPYMKTLNWLIGDLVGGWRDLDDATKDNIIRIAVVGGAILAFITVLGLVAWAISMVIKGFTTLGIILGLVTSGPVLAILGIALAIGFLKKAWDENLGGIQDKTKTVLDTIKGYWARFMTWWEGTPAVTPEGLTSGFDSDQPGFKYKLLAMKQFLVEKWEWVIDIGGKAWKWITETTLEEKLEDTKRWLKKGWEWVVNLGGDAWDWFLNETKLGNAIQRAWGRVEEWWHGVPEVTPEGLTSGFDYDQPGFKHKLMGIKYTFIQTWNDIKDKAVEVWETIKTTVENTWNEIKRIAEEGWESIKGSVVVQAMIEFTGDLWNALKQGFDTGDWGPFWSLVSDGWSKGVLVYLTISSAVQGISAVLSAMRTGLGVATAGAAGLGVEGVLGILTVLIKLQEAKAEGEGFKKFGENLIGAIIAGIAVGGITASPKAGYLAFTVVLNLELGEMVDPIIQDLLDVFGYIGYMLEHGITLWDMVTGKIPPEAMSFGEWKYWVELGKPEDTSAVLPGTPLLTTRDATIARQIEEGLLAADPRVVREFHTRYVNEWWEANKDQFGGFSLFKYLFRPGQDDPEFLQWMEQQLEQMPTPEVEIELNPIWNIPEEELSKYVTVRDVTEELTIDPLPTGKAFAEAALEVLSNVQLPQNLDPRWLVAMWALETGWGKDLKGDFNYGNIITGVDADGKILGYRSYASMEEFIEDFLEVIERDFNLAWNAVDLESFIYGLFHGRLGRYAGNDMEYGRKLEGVLRSFSSGTPWTGWGALDEPAGIVHKREAVIPWKVLKKGPLSVLEFLGMRGFQEGRVPSMPGVSQARATLSWMQDIFNDIADVLLAGLATLFEYIIRAVEVIAVALVGEEKAEEIKAKFQSFYDGITDLIQKMKVTAPPEEEKKEEAVVTKGWQEWLAGLEAAMEEFDWSSPINNFVNTLANGLAQAESYMAQFAGEMVRLIKFVVQKNDDGTRRIVLDFDYMIAQMANSLATMLAEAFTNLLSGYDIPQQRKDPFPSLTELLDNLENYAENQERLRKLQMAPDLATIGGGGLGAGIGFAVGGPLGALIGGFLGALAGRKSAQAATKREIEELTEKLKTDFLAIKEMLGTTMQDVANGLARAFSAETYEDFLNDFSQNLENIVRSALITGFMAREGIRDLIEDLSNEISWAVMDDGELDENERTTILDLYQKIVDESSSFYNALQELGIATGDVADGMKELSGAMRNVPQGLKIVSNRLAAAGYSVPGLHNLAYEEPKDRVTEQKMEIHIHGSIYGVDELKRVIKTTVAETQRRVSLATNGVG